MHRWRGIGFESLTIVYMVCFIYCYKFSQKVYSSQEFLLTRIIGSGALSGKMLLVRIVENNKNDDYFRTG